MDETSIRQYIAQTFAGVDVVDASGGTFFFYGPDHKLPFATLTTSDEYDQASNLSRPNIFRLNVGVSKQTFQSLFGAGSTFSDEAGKEGDYDFTGLDRIMPHPVYGKMHWLCVLNPSRATFKKVRSCSRRHTTWLSASVREPAKATRPEHKFGGWPARQQPRRRHADAPDHRVGGALWRCSPPGLL